MKKLTGKIVEFIFIFLLCTSSEVSSYGRFKVDMLIISANSWMTLKDPVDNTITNHKDSYFNNIKLSSYWHFAKIKGNISIPMAFNFENYEKEFRYAVGYPQDFSAYVGYNLRYLEPRIGLVVPLGYPVSDTIAWLGSRNFKLKYGIGFNAGKYFKERLSINGELMGTLCLNGLEHGTRIDKGSSSLYLALSTIIKVTKSFNVGLLWFPYGSYVTRAEWTTSSIASAGFIPSLLFKFKLSGRSELSAKGGYGFSKREENGLHYTSIVINSSLGFNLYF